MDDELARLVGERIKRLRVQSGVSVREQARVLGISPSSLSALENHRGGMSLSRLQVVAEHFGLHLTDLLSPENAKPGPPEPAVEVIGRADTDRSSVRRGTGVIYQMLGSAPGHQIQPVLITFAPGGGYARDLLAHPGEECAYVILGDVDLLHDDEVYHLSPGDCVRFDTTYVHGYRNASDTAMALVLAVAAPPW